MIHPAASTLRLRQAALLAWLLVSGAGAALPGVADEAPVPDEGAHAFFVRVTAIWTARDTAAWLALWDFVSPELRANEEALLRDEFASDQTTLELQRTRVSPDAAQATADLQLFSVSEPHAHVVHWRLVAHHREGRWRLVARVQESEVEGLVHLSLAKRAWRVRGLPLRLPDFELLMEDGTLFSSPEALGPTVLVFVGGGRVRFSPRPKAEREQLRQFSGSPSLDIPVHWAFVRLDPDDFRKWIEADRLEAEPHPPASRAAKAEQVFRERVQRSYLVDAALPRSPWWLMPTAGDAVVDFPWHHRRVLTFAISAGESEDVNLFDRDRRLQICIYASSQAEAEQGGGLPRGIELLDQELAVRFEPERRELSAVHSMTLKPLLPVSTLRLRLDDSLQVSSIATPDGASLLFFRVREQNSLVVSLGALAEQGRPFTLVTRYGGRHDPAAVDHELLQIPPVSVDPQFEVIVDPPPIVYSNRTAWYPRLPEEAFSPASVDLDTPEGWLAVSGGELLSIRTQDRRTHARFRLAQPGKIITAIVGRLSELGMRQQGEQAVRAFASPHARATANEQIQLAERILSFYAGLFGPDPYTSLNLVVTEAPTPGGFSPPGLVYLQERPPILAMRMTAEDPANFPNVPNFYLAHELAHQWWGQAAAPLDYHERWLSEAWAQYAAALWIREDEGEGAFRGMMDRMARWAERKDQLGPIYLGQRLGMLLGDQRIFRAIVYDKGAWVIHMLRGIVGDEAFFRGARRFLEEHRFARVRTQDLREALERESGKDLRPYFERWIYDTGLPLVQWTERRESVPGGCRTTIEARAEGAPGPLPLDISVTTAAGRQGRHVLLDPSGSSWTFDTLARPRRVDVNDERTVLAKVERVRRLPARP